MNLQISVADLIQVHVALCWQKIRLVEKTRNLHKEPNLSAKGKQDCRRGLLKQMDENNRIRNRIAKILYAKNNYK
jgi:hypothetical protein